MNIVGTLGGVVLKPFTIPFTATVLENATDITTLDSTIYTDFTSQKQEWQLNWTVLTEDEYDALRAVYDNQFTTGIYPDFEVPYYSINTQVRMYINAKDIRKDGCNIYDVQVRLVQRSVS